jgi:DNA-binding transcriptional regulator YdaS (Cro superfamily)
MSLASYMAKNELTDGKLATILGVSDELVRLWRHGRRRISAERAIVLSNKTGIPRHELRPDIWDAPGSESVSPPPESAEAA